MKPLIMGRDPSTDEMPEGAPAFVGSDSGRRLADMCGFQYSYELLGVFDLDNLYRSAVTAWDRVAAAGRLQRLLAAQAGAGRGFVVLCGVDLRVAADLGDDAPLTWHKRWGLDVAWMWHPSGLCRKWNDAATYDVGCSFLRGAIELTREVAQ